MSKDEVKQWKNLKESFPKALEIQFHPQSGQWQNFKKEKKVPRKRKLQHRVYIFSRVCYFMSIDKVDIENTCIIDFVLETYPTLLCNETGSPVLKVNQI